MNLLGYILGIPTIFVIAWLISQVFARVRERPGMPPPEAYGDWPFIPFNEGE